MADDSEPKPVKKDRRGSGIRVSGDVSSMAQLSSIKITQKRGVTFADGQVIGYNIVSILRSGVFATSSPTFGKPFIMVQAFVVLLLAVATVGGCVALERAEHFKIGDGALAATQSSVTTLHGYFGGMLGFIFGYFVFNQLGACNATKKCLSNFLGALLHMVILGNNWFKSIEPGSTDVEVKTQVIRWGMISYVMVCDMGAGRSAEQAADLAMEKGYLTPEEYAVMAELGFRPDMPLLWIIPLMQESIVDVGGLDGRLDKVENLVLAMRGGIGGVLTNVSSFGQPSYPLIVLMSALVKLQLLFQALKSGTDMAVIIYTDTGSKIIQISLVVIMALVTPIFYQGLLEFARQIANPFGDDWVDMAVAHLQEGFKDHCSTYAHRKAQSNAQTIKDDDGNVLLDAQFSM